MTSVAIVTSAHWEGDPRLNRHRAYLQSAGHRVELVSFSRMPRWRAVVRALVAIAGSDAEVVLLPDPELFLPGSIASRATGKRPVIDVHEDYRKTAMSRPWIPDWARWLVGAVAGLATWLGRLVAWRTLVAAPEFGNEGDAVVLNVPDPSSLETSPYDASRRLVYVGDVSIARGALTMVEMLAHLDERFRLEMIGRVGAEDGIEIEAVAKELGVAERVDFVGRLDHATAWERAAGALAGLSLLTPAPAYVNAVATKIWEYLAVGLPVIVTDLPGQGSLLRRVDPTLVCRSVEDMAAVTRRLAEDSSFRDQVVETGRRLVEERWEEARPDLTIQSVLDP